MTRFRWVLALSISGLLASVVWVKTAKSAFDKDPYPQKPGPLQVLFLAGQSNMQGDGSLRNLEYLMYNEETASRYGEFWEPGVERMMNDGVWKGPDWPKLYKVGSERGYHYLGSGKIMYQIGTAFGQGMLQLLRE